MSARDLFADVEVAAFIVRRLTDRAGDRGLSSDAMIALALSGVEGIPEGYDGAVPHDTADLGRCCEAFALAPWRLREAMLPILAEWSHDLMEKRRA